MTKMISEKENCMSWYLNALKKYAVFSGRARRKEYWFFCLGHIIVFLAIEVLQQIAISNYNFNLLDTYNMIALIYSLAIAIPSIAVCVRRLHDVGRKGTWLLISLVPIIGTIVLVVWMCTDGDAGENEYGPDPKLE